MRDIKLAGLFVLLTACGDAMSTGPDAAVSGDATAAVSLNDGYRQATWGAGVTVTYGDCTIRFQSNGLPNHARDAEYAVPNAGVIVPGPTTAHAATDPTTTQAYDVTLDTCPVKQATTTATSLGNIGYMISGASLFNPYEGDAATVALASNFSVTDASGAAVYFVDSCNGHPTPRGQYHYHGLPPCVTAQVDTANGPSHIIGVALDGYPIYGDRDALGAQLTASQLDPCNGITSPTPEFPAGVYHYVLLDVAAATSSIRCYQGKPKAAAAARAVAKRAGCDPTGALAARDPSPMARLVDGVTGAVRDAL
jgi:hypothetical protein